MVYIQNANFIRKRKEYKILRIKLNDIYAHFMGGNFNIKCNM